MIPERFGRYEVLGLLGEGSMGRVYRAFDPLGHRSVAIKTVRPEFLTSEEYPRRFRREAQAAGVLSHPSIITIFDVGENYFVMELLEGVTLQAVLRERGRLPLSEALRILGPVAEALDYAHAKGIIHRDIKPGNLMILPDGRVKIMDFGVAHLATNEMSVSGQFLGSPSYMAPERILRGEATPGSDLFSFAVLAYESLTGKKPFQGDRVSDVVARVVNEQAPPPRAVYPDLPPAFDEIFRRALAKDPGARYRNAAAIFAALSGREAEAPAPLDLPAGSTLAPEASAASGTLVDVLEELARAPTPRAAPWLGPAAVLILLVSVVAGYSLRRLSPATPPAAAEGAPLGLAVETVPAGALVALDGIERGPAPLSLGNLPPGPHTVKVVQEGFAATELSLELAVGMGEVPLRLTLQPLERAPAVPGPRAIESHSTAAAGPAPAPQAHLPTAPAAADSTAPGDGASQHADPMEALSPGKPEEIEKAPDITPPVRISGETPRYPELARSLRLRGTVTVEMTVTEAGEPTELRILQSASPILENAALEAAKTWRFEPARRNGIVARYRGHRVTLSFQP